MDYEFFELVDFVLQNGATIRGCKIASKTFGMLSVKRMPMLPFACRLTLAQQHAAYRRVDAQP